MAFCLTSVLPWHVTLWDRPFLDHLIGKSPSSPVLCSLYPGFFVVAVVVLVFVLFCFPEH